MLFSWSFICIIAWIPFTYKCIGISLLLLVTNITIMQGSDPRFKLMQSIIPITHQILSIKSHDSPSKIKYRPTNFHIVRSIHLLDWVKSHQLHTRHIVILSINNHDSPSKMGYRPNNCHIVRMIHLLNWVKSCHIHTRHTAIRTSQHSIESFFHRGKK
jgi:hypothetical protein